MQNKNKIEEIQKVLDLNSAQESVYFDLLQKVSNITSYSDYMITEPINCNEELKRVDTADYDLCAALLIMLLREDHFDNGSFARRYHNGQVQPILNRMIQLLEMEEEK